MIFDTESKFNIVSEPRPKSKDEGKRLVIEKDT